MADDLLGLRAAPTSGVKSTTSANRMEAELKWSAIGRVCAFSRSAIELGRMLSRRSSAFACSTRSAASACAPLTREHREQREHDRAADGDVEPEHRGREPPRHLRARRGRPSSPAIPEPRNTIANATYQRTADATLSNTSAPSGAEDPPEPDAAGAEEAAERDHRQRRREQDRDLAHAEQPREVARRATNTTIDAGEHGEVRDERTTRPASRTRGRAHAHSRGDRQDQHRDQDEQRLARAQILVVRRIRPDQLQALDDLHRGRRYFATNR